MVSFDELRRVAAQRGVNLLHAYLRAGMADSTYYRHRDQRNGMTVASYNAVLEAINALSGRSRAA